MDTGTNCEGSIDLEYRELGRTGVKIPVLGLGTWGIGGLRRPSFGGEDEEAQSLRYGFDLGMRFVDTAEMYASGHSEEVVAKAVKDQRDRVFIATKVSAEHLAYDDVLKSCNASLKRLGTNYIDLYQIHWPNERIPIKETMKAMEHLLDQGKIRHIGVSNFSVQQTVEAQKALSKTSVVSNQVEYSLLERTIENDLLPFAEREHITIIAYSPVARGQIPRGRGGRRWQLLDGIAAKYRKTRTQIALNWLIFNDTVVAIPKAAKKEHLQENVGAVGWRMSREDHDALSKAFT